MMTELSIGQLDRSSEILGNLAVAWFSAGIASPLFNQSKNLAEIILFIALGITMSLFFFWASLSLAKQVKP